MKKLGKYGRKSSWIVKRYEKYGRKVGWIVKWYGKYRRKVNAEWSFGLTNTIERVQPITSLEIEPIRWHSSVSRAAAAIHVYPRSAVTAATTTTATAAVIALKFHPKLLTNENKTKHFMKISHINVNIYEKAKTSQPKSEQI